MLRPRRLSSRRCVQSVSTVAGGSPAREQGEHGVEPWLRRMYVRVPEGPLRRTASWEELELPLPSTTREAFLSSAREADREDRRGSEREGRDGLKVQSWEAGRHRPDERRSSSRSAWPRRSSCSSLLVGGQLRIGSFSFVLGAMAAAGAATLSRLPQGGSCGCRPSGRRWRRPRLPPSSNIYLRVDRLQEQDVPDAASGGASPEALSWRR